MQAVLDDFGAALAAGDADRAAKTGESRTEAREREAAGLGRTRRPHTPILDGGRGGIALGVPAIIVDAARGERTVVVDRDGEEITLRPKKPAPATGMSPACPTSRASRAWTASRTSGATASGAPAPTPAGGGRRSGPTEPADLTFASIPDAILADFRIPLCGRTKARDAEFHAGLGKAGFKRDRGDDGSGLFMACPRRGAGRRPAAASTSAPAG